LGRLSVAPKYPMYPMRTEPPNKAESENSWMIRVAMKATTVRSKKMPRIGKIYKRKDSGFTVVVAGGAGPRAGRPVR
jgi:hypothetical protein